MTIKYLVLSGGGGGGLYIYGAIKHLSKKGFWHIDNIKQIYCVSIGAFLSILLSLKLDWNTLDDYIIKRPWEKVFNLTPDNILNLFTEKGIFSQDIVKDILNPLLTVNNLSEDITLEEFYNFNKIEIFMYATNINNNIPEKIEISYKSFPNLKLYSAISMSSAFPILFQPIFYENLCILDGGILSNFPLNDCINNINAIENKFLEEILAFKIPQCNIDISNINLNTSIINYLNKLLHSLLHDNNKTNNKPNMKNIVDCDIEGNNSFNLWKDAILNESVRKNMIKIGEINAGLFLENL